MWNTGESSRSTAATASSSRTGRGPASWRRRPSVHPPVPKCSAQRKVGVLGAARNGPSGRCGTTGGRAGAAPREGDGLRTLGCRALDLGHRGIDVPERHHHHGDEAARGGGAPLVEDEVVPRADAGVGQSLSVAAKNVEPAKPGTTGKQSGVDAVEVHFGQTGLHVMATGHIPSKRTGRARSPWGLAGHRVQADRGHHPSLEAPTSAPPSSSITFGPASSAGRRRSVQTRGCSITWSSNRDQLTSSGIMPFLRGGRPPSMCLKSILFHGSRAVGERWIARAVLYHAAEERASRMASRRGPAPAAARRCRRRSRGRPERRWGAVELDRRGDQRSSVPAG